MKNTVSNSLDSLIYSIDFTVSACKKLLEMDQTPANLRGYLAPEEGVALMLLAEHGPGEGAIVEIGSFLGKSTCWLGLGAKAAGRESVTAVDVFLPLSFMASSENEEDQNIAREGSSLPFFLENIEKFGLSDQVEHIQGKSQEVAKDWDSGSIRLLFIDGCHYYEHVKADFHSWAPHVQCGGIIAFHDYSDNWPGVKQFYDEFIQGNPDYSELLTCYTTKFVVKG